MLYLISDFLDSAHATTPNISLSRPEASFLSNQRTQVGLWVRQGRYWPGLKLRVVRMKVCVSIDKFSEDTRVPQARVAKVEDMAWSIKAIWFIYYLSLNGLEKKETLWDGDKTPADTIHPPRRCRISPCLRPPCLVSNLNILLTIAYLSPPRDAGLRAMLLQIQLLYLERRLGVASRTVSASFFDWKVCT